MSVDERWQSFVDRVVGEGRYGSASDVVREGLRLVAQREAKLVSLRATIKASIECGGDVSDEELDSAIEAKSNALRAQGIGA